jgi:hypothetical protein
MFDRSSRRGPSRPQIVRTRSGADGSECRTVSATFPSEWTAAMFRRARQWGRENGGRFEAQQDRIILWSAEQPPREAQVVGWLAVQWDSPSEGQATIHEVGWLRDHGGSPHEMCRAIQLLSGLWMPGMSAG